MTNPFCRRADVKLLQAVPLFLEPEIFIVASLEGLTVRGVRFQDCTGDDLEGSAYKGQTALKKLTLDECCGRR